MKRTLELVSKARITAEGKAQADSKAQHTRQYVSISRGLQSRQRRDHRPSDGVVKPVLIICVGLYLAMACSAAGAEPAAFMEHLDQALRLLYDSSQETCPICAEQTKHKAFALLNEALPPGTIIESDERCVFSRTPEKSSNAMLLSCDASPGNGTRTAVILRFHTAADHLVGVSKLDYTDENTAEEFNFASPGFRFRGSAVVIDYSYGDGPAYNYQVKTGQLYIHCRILSLQPLR